jgi:hypothetical protein
MNVSDQLHAPAALPRVKVRRYLLNMRLSGPQSRCGGRGEDKKSQILPGIEPR